MENINNTSEVTGAPAGVPDKVRLILLENLDGMDIKKISDMLDCSISKVQSYLKGYNTSQEITDKVLNCCFSYFAAKYRDLLSEIFSSKIGVQMECKIECK